MNAIVAFEAFVSGCAAYRGLEYVAVRAVTMINSTQKIYEAVMKIFLRPKRPAIKRAAKAPQGYERVLRTAL
jgi:hypothetical protein